jgi:SAM-dependent methyltransferase
MRSHLLDGISPLSYAWGVDRGFAVHRMHLEQFLREHSGDIRGRCLEFLESLYVPRLGGPAVQTLDILHADATNPRATLIADLTRPNDLPDDRFDCIVCTHVLQSIFELERAMGELYRILAQGGVLLIGVPQISMSDSRYGELWRFTPDGLSRLLTTAFAPGDVTVRCYGNSLTAAGELRGMVASEFSAEVLSTHDPRFAPEICARAVKR